MRYSDLAGKEIIDIAEGTRIGIVNGSDLFLNVETGIVEAIIMPQRGGLFSTREIVIPWEGVRKIGTDFIIVDTSTIEEGYSPKRPAKAKSAVRQRPLAFRHQVPGIVQEEESATVPLATKPLEPDYSFFEDEAPQVMLKRLVNKNIRSSRIRAV